MEASPHSRIIESGLIIMNRRTFIASLGATSALAILGGVLPARALAQAAAPGSADAALAAVMDRIFFHFMDTNPEFATALGLDTGPRAGLKSQLSDYSPASQGRELAAYSGYERELAAIDRAALSQTSALHYDTVRFLAGSIVEGLSRFPYGSNGGRLCALCDQPAGRRLPGDSRLPRPAASGRQRRRCRRLSRPSRGVRHRARPE